MPRVALYDSIGTTYAAYRRPDPRFERAIDAALGQARSVACVGSGTGSYEPVDRAVVAVEPSLTMISQRSPFAAPVVQAVGEHLPFNDSAFDASLAVLTVHHWPDPLRGLEEMARIAPVQVVLTWDPALFAEYWLVEEYLPEIAQHESGLATLDTVRSGLNVVDVRPLPVPWDCTDGFAGAYWRRPERYLDPAARAAISGLSLVDQTAVASAMRRLETDLADGTWHVRHGDLANVDELDLGYRLAIAR
jgi:SAM-dependent methyltransferase